eukprot:scaffold47081_cov64-Phaeocystis_antarctica.AAC.1
MGTRKPAFWAAPRRGSRAARTEARAAVARLWRLEDRGAQARGRLEPWRRGRSALPLPGRRV